MQLNLLTTVILESVTDGVLLADASNRIVHANSQAQLLLRKRSAEVTGLDVMNVLPNLTGSIGEEQLRRAITDKSTARFEHFSSSVYLWYDVRIIPVDEGTLLLIRDITDRNRMMQSEAVREALRQVLKQAPIAITIVRGPDHRFELVNDYALRLVGGRELEGKTARSVFPELEGQGLLKILDDVYRTGQPWQAEEVPVTLDRSGDGLMTEGLFNISYQPFQESDGRVAGVISVSVEVTDLVNRRKELEADK